MNSSIGFFINFEERNANIRQVRNRAVSVFKLADVMFVKLFRVNKAAFRYLLSILENNLRAAVRSTYISPEIKLATFLRFLAEGGYQTGTGNDYNVGLAQPTVSVVLCEVLNIFERVLCPKWISLNMSVDEKRDARAYFYNKSRIPGIVMCVDGTHVKLIKPSKEAHHFYNRKGFYSLNVMVICDHKQRIRYVDAKYPGAAHDSFIWKNSDANQYCKEQFDKGDTSIRILGDSGYPLLPWLITPYRNAGYNNPKTRFNRAHSTGRNIVERTIGMWKNWCRCILSARQLHYSPQKVAQIVNVAAALHNIRLHYNVHDDYIHVEIEEDANEQIQQESEWNERYTQLGTSIRDQILRNFV